MQFEQIEINTRTILIELARMFHKKEGKTSINVL